MPMSSNDDNLSMSLQQTQFYINVDAEFPPTMESSLLRDPAAMTSHESVVWSLFAVLECSGIPRFTIESQWGEEITFLRGGR